MTTKHYVIPSVDNFGRLWTLSPNELCPECGQPDSTGDCNHKRLTDREAEELGSVGTTKSVRG